MEWEPRLSWESGYPLLIEIPHFIMERKMMLGIRERAEGRRTQIEV